MAPMMNDSMMFHGGTICNQVMFLIDFVCRISNGPKVFHRVRVVGGLLAGGKCRVPFE